MSTVASLDRPITVVDIDIEVFQRRPLTGDKAIMCTYGAGGEQGARVFPNLDAPDRPIPMDIDGDGEPDAQLPGGRFVVKRGESEALSIFAKGSEDMVYDLGLTVHFVDSGERKTQQFGTAAQPVRMAFHNEWGDLFGQPGRIAEYDWDPSLKRWLPVQTYFKRRQAEESGTSSASTSP